MMGRMPQWKRLAADSRAAMTRALVGSAATPWQVRLRLLRALGATMGDARIEGPACILGADRLTVGDRVFVNVGVLIDGGAGVTIEDDVAVGPRVTIVTSSHDYWWDQHRAGRVWGKPVTIGRGSWIGAGVTILPGVTVGHGCVVAAGSVVTKDCDPDGLYLGSPARRVRDLPTGLDSAPTP